MRQVHVGDALAVAELQRLEFGAREDAQELVFAQSAQARANLGLRHNRIAEGLAVLVGHLQKAREELFRIGPPADRQEIDQLNEEAGVALAGLPHAVDQPAQAGQKAVVADAQQRAARDVADAGRLDHDRARAAARKALVPVDDLVGDVAFLGRPPRHHRRNPGALLEPGWTDHNWREQARGGGFLPRRHAPERGLISDALWRTPHISWPTSVRSTSNSAVLRWGQIDGWLVVTGPCRMLGIAMNLPLQLPKSRDDIRKIQSERKRIAFEWAKKIPWYRGKLDHIDPAKLDDPEHWRRIPIL